jgi:hypothetical protein
MYFKLENSEKVTGADLQLLLRWCKKNIGKSKFHSNTTLKIRFSPIRKWCGQFIFGRNEILIDNRKIEDKIDLVQTVLHEYIHFCQDDSQWKTLNRPINSKKFSINSKNNTEYREWYFTHPLEKEAEDIAIKLYKKCYKEVFNN